MKKIRLRGRGHHLPSASGSKWVSWSLHVEYGECDSFSIKKQICIVYKNYMDDTFSVDMFSLSLDQFVLILTPDMQKTNVLSGSEKLAQKRVKVHGYA